MSSWFAAWLRHVGVSLRFPGECTWVWAGVRQGGIILKISRESLWFAARLSNAGVMLRFPRESSWFAAGLSHAGVVLIFPSESSWLATRKGSRARFGANGIQTPSNRSAGGLFGRGVPNPENGLLEPPGISWGLLGSTGASYKRRRWQAPPVSKEPFGQPPRKTQTWQTTLPTKTGGISRTHLESQQTGGAKRPPIYILGRDAQERTKHVSQKIHARLQTARDITKQQPTL